MTSGRPGAPPAGREPPDRAESRRVARELADLRSRLDRAESVLAIFALKARYAELVDRRYLRGEVADPSTVAEAAEEAAALFVEDGLWDGGPALGQAVGRHAIAERLRDTTLVFGRHLFVSPVVGVDPDDPDRARGRWQLLSPCRDAQGRDLWVCGVEDDEYERVGGRWLHRSMRLTTVATAPLDRAWSVFG